MDAFYASVEQLDHPEWRGLPVIVGSDSRRGVVATASYEARRFGVRSAMPGVTAKRLCPDGIFVAPRMSRYSEVSAQVFDVLGRVTPEVEGLSLDEAFLDVGASLRLFGSLTEIGTLLKREVLAATGLRCSVGMAHNKLLAKLATELGKPDGLYHLLPERVHETLDPLPVGRLWTVGKVAEARLAAHRIATIGQLRRASRALLGQLFGSHGAELARLAAKGKEPVFKAVATQGTGVVETFVGLLFLTYRLLDRTHDLSRRLGIDGEELVRTAALQLGVQTPIEELLGQKMGGTFDGVARTVA